MTRVIYLHGFASSPGSRKARFFRDRLEAAGVRVDVPDLAAGDFQHLTITGQLQVIERLAAGQAVALIGSSLGGYLAALYAARHPEVTRLVLLAPAFGYAERWPLRLGGAAVEHWQRTGSMEVFHFGAHRMMPVWYGLLEDACKYESDPDFRQPALIFHGALDNVVPVEYSERFAATHPNARLEVLRSGHELLVGLRRVGRRAMPFLLEGGG